MMIAIYNHIADIYRRISIRRSIWNLSDITHRHAYISGGTQCVTMQSSSKSSETKRS